MADRLSRDELQEIGRKWQDDCPQLVGLALTGEIGPGTSTGLMHALGIAQFSGDYLGLQENSKWRADVQALKTALIQCEWEDTALV